MKRTRHQRRQNARKSRIQQRTRRVRRRISRRQRGGEYGKEALKDLLRNTPNYNESVAMYRAMDGMPLINFMYPHYARTTRIGQNGEIPVDNFIILIGVNPPDVPEEMDDNVRRDLIFILITAENNTYKFAAIIPFPDFRPVDVLAAIRTVLGVDTVRLSSVIGTVAEPTALRPAYNTIIDALKELYTKQGPNGQQVGVSES